jgi:hypothetical protein
MPTIGATATGTAGGIVGTGIADGIAAAIAGGDDRPHTLRGNPHRLSAHNYERLAGAMCRPLAFGDQLRRCRSTWRIAKTRRLSVAAHETRACTVAEVAVRLPAPSNSVRAKPLALGRTVCRYFFLLGFGSLF